MYFEQAPKRISIQEVLDFDPNLANKIQVELIKNISPENPMIFIEKHAANFRTLFDAHPEWNEMYRKDKEGTLLLIRELLEGTIH